MSTKVVAQFCVNREKSNICSFFFTKSMQRFGVSCELVLLTTSKLLQIEDHANYVEAF